MNILITGAAGSIGSEVVKRLVGKNHLILLDKAETPLYHLDNELREDLSFTDFDIYIGNITSTEDVRYCFDRYKPEIVYHVAAYKHVPLMEANPRVAFINNVYGTKLLADASVAQGVKKFIFVSSDKAVNPTNVMGASKAIAEMYVQSRVCSTDFITTRFGNVFGSVGSVIPRWEKQKREGKPITVTDPEMTRFFMSIPDAADLVVCAGELGNNGDILSFDMGEPVNIDALAHTYSNNIIYTGLRPGEKLHEEIVKRGEGYEATENPKIFRSRGKVFAEWWIDDCIKSMMQNIYERTDMNIVRRMKEILFPHYVSRNSEYCLLDESVRAYMNPNDDYGIH